MAPGNGTREARKSCEWSDGEWDGWVRMWVRASVLFAHVGSAGLASARALDSAMEEGEGGKRAGEVTAERGVDDAVAKG